MSLGSGELQIPATPTVGLSVISRFYDDDVIRIVNDYGRWFDQIYIQINGTGATAPSDLPDKVQVSFFEWVDDFSQAREALKQYVKTDYWMWFDTDDYLINPEKIPELVAFAVRENYDVVFLPYQYDYNQAGELVAQHLRERLVRTRHPYVWTGSVHESLVSPIPHAGITVTDHVIIKHRPRNQSDLNKAIERNHAIMMRDFEAGQVTPMLLYYLGTSFALKQDLPTALKMFQELTTHPDNTDVVYNAWIKIADLQYRLGHPDLAINATMTAINLRPDWPDAFLTIGDLNLSQGRPDSAIHWVEMGLTKNRPQMIVTTDPTLYTYQPQMVLALAYLACNEFEKAKAAIDKAAEFNPGAENFPSVREQVYQAFYQEQAIRSAEILSGIIQNQGNPKAFIDSLPQFIRTDGRLRQAWEQSYPSKSWGPQSIVFYCGQQWEDWGPETIKQGMGGSEEAIVYLAPALAKLGWEITVYNHRARAEQIDGVEWLPWTKFNPIDQFNIFVAWRNPALAFRAGIEAKLSCVDMHDTPVSHQEITAEASSKLDLVFFKGHYHRNFAPDLPDDKAVIISNGIIPTQFNNPGIKRQPQKVIYASSADRGLDLLVSLWPKVKTKIPDAELVWAYGWNSFDAMHAGSTEQSKWKWQLRRAMHNAGVKELGRLGHEELAKEMMSCSVWAYPTSFPEINCITALKAQAAGVQPVTSGFAALQETVVTSEPAIEGISNNPDAQAKFLARLIRAIKHPLSDDERTKISHQVLKQYDYNQIAKQWDQTLASRLEPAAAVQMPLTSPGPKVKPKTKAKTANQRS